MKDFLLKLHAQGKYSLKIKLALEHFNNWMYLATAKLLEQKYALIMHRHQEIRDLAAEVKWIHSFLQIHALNESSH